ncbi:MAG: glycosyltransferase family 4 protein [Bdellovibrionota bacterium]
MKTLMLGWEYPPHISGGLGTACQGLTTALAKLGVKIDFVIPKVEGDEHAEHMAIIDPASATHLNMPDMNGTQNNHDKQGMLAGPSTTTTVNKTARNIRFVEIPANLYPYAMPNKKYSYVEHFKSISKEIVLPAQITEILERAAEQAPDFPNYNGDLFAEVDRYTKNVIKMAGNSFFDIIHAHDWMTFPAGIALSRLTGVPLVTHVHSLEHDRSGDNVNEHIHIIERSGVENAHTVIAVSYYTRSVINQQHGIPLDKIAVVHNGVYSKEVVQSYKKEKCAKPKIVLFLGRITFQKGPDYFVEAAAKVIPAMPDVTFVMAGTGDMLNPLINRVTDLGLEKHFVFTGFLKGEEVERMFSVADLYVMPSVSEPFGITPLEAMNHDVPVIISKQSGVSEILKNALKIDYWDVDKLAHLIISVLKYPEVREDIATMAREEVRRIRWEAAAEKVFQLYCKILGATAPV